MSKYGRPLETVGLGVHANSEGRFGEIIAHGMALARFILDAHVSVEN